MFWLGFDRNYGHTLQHKEVVQDRTTLASCVLFVRILTWIYSYMLHIRLQYAFVLRINVVAIITV